MSTRVWMMVGAAAALPLACSNGDAVFVSDDDALGGAGGESTSTSKGAGGESTGGGSEASGGVSESGGSAATGAGGSGGSGGSGEVTCEPDETKCGGACVDLQTSLDHCGECGSACDGTCEEGACIGSFHDSKIITLAEGKQINEWVGIEPNHKWTLCYRMTEHGSYFQELHSRCDGKGPTIVVADLATGKRVGGYAPVSLSICGCYFGNETAFLFSLTNKFKHAYPGTTGEHHWMYGGSSQHHFGSVGPPHTGELASVNNNGILTVRARYLGYVYQCRIGVPLDDNCAVDFVGTNGLATALEYETWVK